MLTSATGSTAATLAYDPLLRLYDVTGAATTRFLYDGTDVIGEYSTDGTPQRRYVHGPSMDEPLVQYEGTGTTDRRWLHADERGSVIATSDSSGNMLAINRYDEFGKPQATNAGRFQYTGQMWLPELGLQYSKARMYAPHLGRFLQTDPIGYEGGVNLYAYVGNDPINFTDPLGLCAQSTEAEIVVCGHRKSDDSAVTASAWASWSMFPAPVGGWAWAPAPSAPGGFGGAGPLAPPQTPPKPPKPPKRFTCTNAMKQPGKIKATGVTVTAVLALGWTATRGTWTNLSTGTTGKFVTLGFAAGFEAGSHLSTMTYSNIGAFTGFSDGYSAGVSVPVGPIAVGGSYSHSSNASGSGSGGSLGVSPGDPFPSAGASGNFTETTISQCKRGS